MGGICFSCDDAKRMLWGVMELLMLLPHAYSLILIPHWFSLLPVSRMFSLPCICPRLVRCSGQPNPLVPAFPYSASVPFSPISIGPWPQVRPLLPCTYTLDLPLYRSSTTGFQREQTTHHPNLFLQLWCLVFGLCPTFTFLIIKVLYFIKL